MSPLFANSLLQDISQLLNDPDNCNVLIEVGERHEKEIFKAHSIILMTRSPYFKTELSSDSVKKENNKFILTKPKISPKVFRKILKYIYTGEISLKEDNIQDILLELLLVADELALLKLVNYLEEYIISYESDWIQENFATIFPIASNYQNFTRLYKLLTDNSSTLPSSALVMQKLLDSTLIDNKKLALLASWIDSKNNDETNFNLSNNAYKFNLLLRGSRDGMSLREFHQLCINKGPTLVIIKIKGSNQIIGGYNPTSWSLVWGAKYLDNAFIFSLGDGKNYDHIILSRAKYNEISTQNISNSLIGFTDLKWFQGMYFGKSGFEKEIMEVGSFVIEDYEVFEVINNPLQSSETSGKQDDDERVLLIMLKHDETILLKNILINCILCAIAGLIAGLITAWLLDCWKNEKNEHPLFE